MVRCSRDRFRSLQLCFVQSLHSIPHGSYETSSSGDYARAPAITLHPFISSFHFYSPLKRLSGRFDGLSLSRHSPAIVTQSRVGNRLPATAGTLLIGQERPSSTRDRLVRALPKSTTRLPP